METLETLPQALHYFSSFENCKRFIVSLRWPDGVVRCPQCHSDKVAWLETARVWKCYAKHPRAKFSLKTGTFFEGSLVGFDKWLPCVWLFVNSTGLGVRDIQLSLGVTHKTAWFMLHRLRTAMTEGGKGSPR